MLEYHVYKKYAVAAKYRPTNEQVVEIDDTRGNPPVPVRAIREECFSGAKIGLVTLPKSVTTIEARAFYESTVTSLVTVRTPGEIHLKEIGESSFQRSHLDGQIRLVVCDGSLEIGPDAFSECSELEEVEIVGSGTVRLHERAFRDCHKLRVFRCMQANLTSLPEQVFENCTELHTIAIPSLKRAGPRACANCLSLYGFPKVLDSFYPDSFVNCSINRPKIRQKKRKCDDDTLRIPTAEEIEAMIPQDSDIGVGAAFQSFNQKYQDKEPIMRFKICSSDEKVDMMHPIIKGYFRKDLIEQNTFHFEVTVPMMECCIHLIVECAANYNSLLRYLAEDSSIVQVIGMQTEDQYNVFEIIPSSLSDSSTFTREFYDEIMARLSGCKTTGFTIKTVDQARLFLKLMSKEAVPDEILQAIERELDGFEHSPGDVQKHRLQTVRALCNINFVPRTPIKIPPIAVIKKNFDIELGGMTRVKQTLLSIAASIRQTGSMPARRGILLVGSPGTGKSHITKTFCKQTDLELIELDFSAMGDGTNLQGSGREFSNGTYSLVVRKALQTKQRQMRFVVQVEELDKSPSLHNTLLNMLTGSFYDSYLETTINTEQLFFIMTANSIQNISAPLLSRLKVVFVDSYSRKQKIQILRDILIPEANKKYNLTPGFQLQSDLEQLLVDYYLNNAGIRELKSAVSDIVDYYHLESETRGPHELKRVYTKNDIIQQILGPSATTYIPNYDPNPGEVRFLYTDLSGEPKMGVVQVSFSVSDNPKIEILGATGTQQCDHVRMALSAVRSTTSLNLSEIDLYVAFPEPIQSQQNVLGLPVFLAIQSALREEPIARGALAIGAGIDLFGNGYLPKGPMTSLVKTAIDMDATTVVAPAGFSDRIDTVDLETTPVIIESNNVNELVRFLLKN